MLQGGWQAFGVVQVEHRLPLGAKEHTGIGGWKESALPKCSASARSPSCIEHDVTGQVAGLAAQPVGNPGTHRGHAETRYSALHLELAGVVIEFFRVHRADHQDIVRDGTEVGHEVAEFRAGLPVFLEGPLGSHEGRRGRFDKCETGFVEDAFGQALPGHFVQLGLGIEEIYLGRRSRHEDEDAGLGLGIKVRFAWGHRILKSGFVLSFQQALVGQQGSEGDPAEPEAEVARKSRRVRSRWFSIGFMMTSVIPG